MMVRKIEPGDYSTRIIGGMKFHQSGFAPNKQFAVEDAEYWRGKGALVRVVKLTKGYGLYTR